jgi:hypothetical protein
VPASGWVFAFQYHWECSLTSMDLIGYGFGASRIRQAQTGNEEAPVRFYAPEPCIISTSCWSRLEQQDEQQDDEYDSTNSDIHV